MSSAVKVFHFWGDAIADSPFFWRWDPRSLPHIPGGWAHITLPAAITAVVATVIALQVLTLPQSFSVAGLEMSIDPAPYGYLFPLRLLVFGLLALATLNLFQRYWTRVKLLAAGLLTLGTAACLIGIVAAPAILHVTVSAHAPVPAPGPWAPFIPDLNIRIALGVVAGAALYRCLLSWFRTVLKPVPWI